MIAAAARQKTLETTPSEFQYVDQSEAFKNFINSVDSEETKTNYRTTFPFFMKFCKLTTYQEMTQIDIQRLEGLIRDYIIYLREDKKLAPGTIAVYVSPVAHFYEMNDVIVNWKKLKKFKGRLRTVVEDQPYTHEQIKSLLERANLRDQCIILLMASAGLRRGAIPMLRIKDLIKIDKYQLYKISVYKNEHESYTAFCSPECAKLIDKYLDWRQRLGEKLKPTSPLFRKVFDVDIEVHAVKPISKYVISTAVNSLLEKSGIRMKSAGSKFKRTELMQCHGFRKFFHTNCINHNMNPVYGEYLMGHKTGLMKSYFKPTDNELLEGNDQSHGYTSIIPYLTINATEEENQRLRQELANQQESHSKEWELARKQIDQLRQKMGLI